MRDLTLIFASWLLALSVQPSFADDPKIETVTAVELATGWRIDVTLSHPDTGWEHYANGWRVLDMQGNELGLRVLAHPHEHEQPFTRSLSGLSLPDGVTKVQIEARCLVDGWAPLRYVVSLH